MALNSSAGTQEAIKELSPSPSKADEHYEAVSDSGLASNANFFSIQVRFLFCHSVVRFLSLLLANGDPLTYLV